MNIEAKFNIGDIIKANKASYVRLFDDKLMIVVDHARGWNTNEYKVIVCGYPNKFYYILEYDIAGKIE